MSNNNLRQKYHKQIYTQRTVGAVTAYVAESYTECPLGHSKCVQVADRLGIIGINDESGTFYTNFSTLRNLRAMNHIHTYNEPNVSIYLTDRDGMDTITCPSGHANCEAGPNPKTFREYETFFYRTEDSYDNEVAHMRQKYHEQYIKSLNEIDDGESCWVATTCPLGHGDCQGYEFCAISIVFNGVWATSDVR